MAIPLSRQRDHAAGRVVGRHYPIIRLANLAHKPGGVQVHISHGELTIRNLEFQLDDRLLRALQFR